ncbi:MAG: nucleotidyltransferase family protein [Gemmataceae bacterium]|nr:nucleotidyltransferase family protein [Gemmataceae bacterium]
MSQPCDRAPFAVVPAAGLSRRMGQPKLTLPLGRQTVIEHVIAALHEGGFQSVVTVAPAQDQLASLAQQAGALVLELPEPTSHMRETVQFTLDYLYRRFNCPSESFWLLVPADHPCIDSELIRSLRNELATQPELSIAVPVYRGRRGHPTLIRWKHYSSLSDFDASLGLNLYLRQFPGETLEITVDNPDVLLDLDTPEDYLRLCDRFG